MDFQVLLEAAVLAIPGVVILSGVIVVVVLCIYFAKRCTKYHNTQIDYNNTFR